MAGHILSTIFLAAFVFEVLVTGALFLHRSSISMPNGFKFWGIVSMGLVSIMNLIGFLRLQSLPAPDLGSVVQAGFAFSTLNLFVFVWFFHKRGKKWGDVHGEIPEDN